VLYFITYESLMIRFKSSQPSASLEQYAPLLAGAIAGFGY